MLIEKITGAAVFAGGGTAMVFGLSTSEWSVVGVIGGLLVGVGGLIVNIYFKHKHLQVVRNRYAETDL